MASSSIRETKGFEIQTRDVPTPPKRASLSSNPCFYHQVGLLAGEEGEGGRGEGRGL